MHGETNKIETNKIEVRGPVNQSCTVENDMLGWCNSVILNWGEGSPCSASCVDVLHCTGGPSGVLHLELWCIESGLFGRPP